MPTLALLGFLLSTFGLALEPAFQAPPEEAPWLEIKKDLHYQELEVGDGGVVKRGHRVQVYYVGRFEDGSVFDQKVDAPFSFVIGGGQVIRGWELGVVGMKEGGKRRLRIGHRLAYGKRGRGPIPKKATLVFDIQLLSTARL